MEREVRHEFDKFLIKTFAKKPQILQALKSHERKEKCIQNLCREIQIVEKRKAAKMNRSTFLFLIEQVAKLFAEACIMSWEKQAMSEIRLKSIGMEEANRQSLQEELDKNEAAWRRGSIKRFVTENYTKR